MNIQTTKTRVRNSLSFNGKLGLKLKIFRIWFDGDVPRAQVNLWNPLSYAIYAAYCSIDVKSSKYLTKYL